jgi:anti-sigma regulatory factor (Ser/Thr protein kinase)
MGNMRQIIRGIAQVHADPALMLDAADRALRLEHPEKFVTAFVGVYDPINNTLTYASAGQPPPLLRHPDGRIEPLAGTGLPLGLRSNSTHSGSTTIDLAAGSCLLLYTDGLTESDRAPLSGEQRMLEIFADVAADPDNRPAERIVERMMNGAAARDDVAVLVLTVRATPDRDSRGRESLQRWTLQTHDARSVTAARRVFAAAFADHGAARDDVAIAEVVFGELVSNTVRYAAGAVEVIVDWSGPDPVLHVIDNGPGFRHIAILPPDLLSESGRGLFIVSAFTQDFRVSKGPRGGSHACAVLRMQGRQLVDFPADAYASALVHGFGERLGRIAE